MHVLFAVILFPAAVQRYVPLLESALFLTLPFFW